ncbi:7 transmembrane receptor (rhodopsin family) domain-containing protein [Ditylenchus destructor]|uniref:7 transmembrane receptor (Rhodopsin family) domain-containing protein n=1 Tax=Ditylenchus destructor TaxID=166010 RepID=A0AAD4NGW2_9BILA|nr:7 transmembrane receptor (rhodopsin family) domain-containing protein [Ditylenchus destructor]
MNVCLPAELLRLQGSHTENLFFRFVFPWLCFIGIVGNCLNLTVLLSSDKRSRRSSICINHRSSDALLVSLAFCDILFLLLMLPHSLANFDYFGLDFTFRTLYLPSKIHLISTANWCSAVAIWLIIAICAERLIGIGNCEIKKWTCCRTGHVIAAIVLICGVLTSYNHFSYHCVVKLLCNGTQIISKCFDVVQENWSTNHTNLTPAFIRSYVQWSQVLNVIAVIVVPILIMIALNLALLFVVRQQSFLVYNRLYSASLNSNNSGGSAPGISKGTRKISAMSDSGKRKSSVVVFSEAGSNEGLDRAVTNNTHENPTQQARSNLFRRSIDQTMQFQAEHRVTVTVCAIVTCFTITQGPSAIVLSLSFFSGHKPPFVNSNALWYHANCVTGFLVIIGKTLNFILFCFSSATFRRRLMRILQSKLLYLSDRRNSFLGSSCSTGGPSNSSLKKQQIATERKFSLAN